MSRREAKLLVGDIIDSAEKILAYTQGMTYDDFIADEKTVDAVIRNFEIIGEAANRLPIAFKLLHPKIDWNQMRGFRNRIVHDYIGIDYTIVWQIKEVYLPHLLHLLKGI
jgi:uncharacterized protein with HEPN domain